MDSPLHLARTRAESPAIARVPGFRDAARRVFLRVHTQIVVSPVESGTRHSRTACYRRTPRRVFRATQPDAGQRPAAKRRLSNGSRASSLRRRRDAGRRPGERATSGARAASGRSLGPTGSPRTGKRAREEDRAPDRAAIQAGGEGRRARPRGVLAHRQGDPEVMGERCQCAHQPSRVLPSLRRDRRRLTRAAARSVRTDRGDHETEEWEQRVGGASMDRAPPPGADRRVPGSLPPDVVEAGRSAAYQLCFTTA